MSILRESNLRGNQFGATTDGSCSEFVDRRNGSCAPQKRPTFVVSCDWNLRQTKPHVCFQALLLAEKKHPRIRRKFRIPRFIGPFILELQTMAPAKKAKVFHRKNSTGVQSVSSGHGFDGRWVAWCCLGYSQRMFDDTMSGLFGYMFGEFPGNSYWTPKISWNFR